jgi:hypothetical protein
MKAANESGPEATAQRAADALALALEDAGFDVGRTFPSLVGTVARNGTPMVEVGAITAAVASRLADVLTHRPDA